MNTQLPLPPLLPQPHRAGPVESWLSRLLTIGVLTAAAVSLLGGILYLWSEGHGRTSLADFRGQPEPLTQPLSIIQGAAQLDPKSLMQLGVMLLILTPVARVAFALVLFALTRDRLYVLISFIVLATLIVALA
jgi:uncharacterized membrane protein